MSDKEKSSIEQFKADHPDIPITDLSKHDDSSIADVLTNAIDVMEGPKFMNRGRPYNGQPWTDQGIRGQTEVKGLTMRDIRDCYIRAYIKSHSYYVYDEVSRRSTLIRQEPNATLSDEAEKGEKAQLNGNDLYTLVGDADPIAIAQNLSVEIEKMMGIFPNIGDMRRGESRCISILDESPFMDISEPGQSPNPPCDTCDKKTHDDKDSY